MRPWSSSGRIWRLVRGIDSRWEVAVLKPAFIHRPEDQGISRAPVFGASAACADRRLFASVCGNLTISSETEDSLPIAARPTNRLRSDLRQDPANGCTR